MTASEIALAFALTLLPIGAFFFIYLKVTNQTGNQPGLRDADFLGKLFSSRSGNYFVFLWAFFEAIYWWVFPDFLLILAGVYTRRLKPTIVLFAVVGTACGGTVAFIWATQYPATTTALLDQVPFVSDAMTRSTERIMAEHGPVGVLNHPVSGVPFKVFTYTSGQLGTNLAAFILLAALGRGLRFMVVFYGVHFAARLFGDRIKMVPSLYVLVAYTLVYTIGLLLVSSGRILNAE